MTIHIVIEESETGSLAHGSPYCLLSAHATMEHAEAAVTAWQESHGTPEHAMILDDGMDWCEVCSNGVSIDTLELEA